MAETIRRKAYYKNRDADERQAALYKRFPPSTFLGVEENVDHFMQWVTFFRRNLHRFATDYLGIKLHLYQAIMLYLMGINDFFVVIASRASAKSFMVALYAVCRCILYPNSMVVVASATKKQAKLIVSEKIDKELCSFSPVLRKEIKKIKDNQNDIEVRFYNGSTITVVVAGESSRGYRSTVIIREEYRQIKKNVDDSILSPFQIIRQVPCLKNEYYENISELEEQNIDIYISSSWFDNGHWLWQIVDQAFDAMMKGEKSCLLAFDESIALREKIKTQKYFQTEKKKQDSMTWALEFLNVRLKSNAHSFFSYEMITQNQNCKKPFYPRTAMDVKLKKKNPFAIPKQPGEIRLVACDMAFIEGKSNDNSVFSCVRCLPESKTYNMSRGEVDVDTGYRRIVPYMEHSQGGETARQARRIRQLYNDFEADYIILDTRNAGVSVLDCLGRVMYDEERDCEYSPLICMNDESLAARTRVEGAEPRIYAISATQKLNSDIALDFRRVLSEQKIDFLVNFEIAKDEILSNIQEYTETPDGEVQAFYETPFLETQEFVSEATNLTYEKKEQTGLIVIRESGTNRKDRYTSCSYASWFVTQLEKDGALQSRDYEFQVFVN